MWISSSTNPAAVLQTTQHRQTASRKNSMIRGVITALVLAGTAALIQPTIADADEVAFGAAFVCRADDAYALILAHVEADSPLAGTPQPLPSKGKEEPPALTRGEHTLNCRLKGATVTAKVRSWEPTQHYCGGVGGALVRMLSVNGTDLLRNLELNSACADNAIVAVSVQTQGSEIVVTQFRGGAWNWETGFGDLKAEEQHFRLSDIQPARPSPAR
jgi:hypothetical protein